MINYKETIEKLNDDKNYYGKYGKQFLSYSDIGSLIKNPETFRQKEETVNMLLGNYLHTLVLQPEKVDTFKLIDATTRNTKIYKEASDGDLLMLQHEADTMSDLHDKLLANNTTRNLIRDPSARYEQPNVKELEGEMWKCKADIVTDEYVIDLKTTSDISKFRWSAFQWNYDAQAYVYTTMFDKDFLFVVIDKKTKQIGVFDCSDHFLKSGRDKVIQAVLQYRLLFKDKDMFDPTQYLINETL